MREIYIREMTLKIKELRKARGMTQEELAAIAGVSRSQFSEIESEKKPANTLRLNAIAAALGVTLDQLFEVGSRDLYKDELNNLVDMMDGEDRDAFIRMARSLAHKR